MANTAHRIKSCADKNSLLNKIRIIAKKRLYSNAEILGRFCYNGFEIERISEIINSDHDYRDYDFFNAKDLYFNIYNPIKIIIDDIIKL